MSASLVGSEMCIRDRPTTAPTAQTPATAPALPTDAALAAVIAPPAATACCLLYTSDAADDM
eukprot:9338802-Alexandrium_andersonii.AAC.1